MAQAPELRERLIAKRSAPDTSCPRSLIAIGRFTLTPQSFPIGKSLGNFLETVDLFLTVFGRITPQCFHEMSEMT